MRKLFGRNKDKAKDIALHLSPDDPPRAQTQSPAEGRKHDAGFKSPDARPTATATATATTESTRRIPNTTVGEGDDKVQDLSLITSTNSVGRQRSSRRKSSFTPFVTDPGSRTTTTVNALELLDQQNDPLGLTVVWEPEERRALDIILVHGLGGTSHSTWSKDRDPNRFWPHKWLPNEPEICTARVLSFGYDADCRSTNSRTISNITDFARDLLFQMKFAKDGNSTLEDLQLGDVPIVFVVHSMGGLVVKKAYMLGQTDEEYSAIIKAISSIIFLSTPHRGSDLANLLSRILSASIRRFSPQYVADLSRNSPALEELNEQFRKVAPKLQIISFYETLETAVGPKKVMILEKDSAVLGYPGEISKPMRADHHGVCKYNSPQDSNYISLRDILKTLVDRVRSLGTGLSRTSSSDRSQHIETLLAVSDHPNDDYNFFRDRWLSGTCEWILQESLFNEWLQDSMSSCVLWIHALPASGKSVLASYIINHVKSRNIPCQYYFFRFGEPLKRTLNGFLRSMAYQIAQDVPQFRRALRDLGEDGMRLEKSDSRTLWRRLFVPYLFNVNLPQPIYWVIDALNECDSPQLLLELLDGLKSSTVGVRILIISRESQALSLAFSELSEHVSVQTLSMEHSQPDIRFYVESKLQFLRWGQEFKDDVSRKILEKADGSFLWVHLAIQQVLKRHTIEDIEQALRDLPTGLKALYSRMEATMAVDCGPRDQQLAKRILTWATCSRTPLTLKQLSEALNPEFPSIPDLRTTIPDLCGHFVVVDIKNQVNMIHQTARDYVTMTPQLQFYIDTKAAHDYLFARCMAHLLDRKIRSKVAQTGMLLNADFLEYAAMSWPFHLKYSQRDLEENFSLLRRFLQTQNVLLWVQALAQLRQTKTLVYASRVLSDIASKKGKSGVLDLEDKELFALWSVDLLKLVGKFGHILLEDPASIQRSIPEFCPRNSVLHRQFGGKSRSISVTGISNHNWDDSIAQLSIKRGFTTEKILCCRCYFAVIGSNERSFGATIMWNAKHFAEEAVLEHGEYITASCFSSTGDRYVSCGPLTTKIWGMPAADLFFVVQNPPHAKVLSVTFTEDQESLLAAFSDRELRCISLVSPSPKWQDMQSLRETAKIHGAIANDPCCVAFNSDRTQVAVAYRGFPVSVYNVEYDGSAEDCVVGRCQRQATGRGRNDPVWSGANVVQWNSRTNHILGLYNDGCIFKWDPYEQESNELRMSASAIQCSPDGVTFATWESNGVIKLYNFESFSLLYKLKCDQMGYSLTFSPNSRRFYEVRDSICTVWEPAVLERLQETEDQRDGLKDGASSTMAPSEHSQSAELLEPITAMAVSAGGDYFCTGNEDGVVSLFDNQGKLIVNAWESPRLMMIDQLVWNTTGTHLAIAELGGNITVRLLKPPSTDATIRTWAVPTVCEFELPKDIGKVQSMVFSPDGNYLLLAGEYTTQAWHCTSGEHTATLPASPENPLKWLNNPLDNDELLAVSFESVSRFTWKCLERVCKIPLHTSPDESKLQHQSPTPSLNSGRRNSGTRPRARGNLVKVQSARDGSCILVERNKSGLQSEILVLDTAALRPDSGRLLRPRSVPANIAKGIDIVLGVLDGEELVFLDQHYAMCTWLLNYSNASDEDIRRHFFLPREWINTESLRLMHLSSDGTLFFPKNGEVAVIQPRLGSEW